MTKPKHFLVVLAGGSGTRLWPLSRLRSPKQIVRLVGKKTLLQLTMSRLSNISDQRIIIVTNASYASVVRKQLPKIKSDQLIVEPFGRGTAAAIGLAAAIVARRHPQAVVTIINSDQVIKNEAVFRQTLRNIPAVIQKYPDQVVMLGITPGYPEIGYGYIELGKFVSQTGLSRVIKIKRFCEKPDLATAKKFVSSKKFLWNPAIFSSPAETWLGLLKQFMPKTAAAVTKATLHRGKKDFNSVLSKVYQPLENISIDYGVMEKNKQALVIPADLGWADIGHWRSVHQVLAPTAKVEVAVGRHLSIEGQGNLIYSTTGRLIATLGLKNMIIVDTPDALLLCPKDKAQRVRELVARLTDKSLNRYA